MFVILQYNRAHPLDRVLTVDMKGLAVIRILYECFHSSYGNEGLENPLTLRSPVYVTGTCHGRT